MRSMRVLLDARWIGRGGAGRVTEMVLQGLKASPPRGDWTVWGAPELRPLLWAEAQIWEDSTDPRAMFGQRSFFATRPQRFDTAVFLHQVRPLRRMATTELTMVYDTIPFRHPSMPRVAALMRMYMKTVARRAEVVLTGSDYSKGCIERDLGIAPEKVRVLPLAVDPASAQRIHELRTTIETRPTVLYVGADQPHKNLDRLTLAFESSEFCATGGRLLIVGVGDDGVERLTAGRGHPQIEVLAGVPQHELERLLASTSCLVQPSLEEGFGLPVAEALAAGIPVAVSNGGSLPEITKGLLPLFDPHNVTDIARAIDRMTVGQLANISPPKKSWPAPHDLAGALKDVVAELG